MSDLPHQVCVRCGDVLFGPCGCERVTNKRSARGAPDPNDKQYPTDPRGQHDIGAQGRIPPCIKRTWCVLADDHPGSCVEVPRYPINPGDFGPRRTR